MPSVVPDLMKILLLAVCVACLCTVSVFGNVPLGRVWERVDELGGQQSNRVCPVGTTVYAIGNGGGVWMSSDWQTWTKEETAAKEDLYGIIHSDGTLVAVGAGGRILRKPNGGNWGAQSSGVTTALRAITRGGGQFVAVGDGGTVLRSADGVNWSIWPSGFTEHLYDVTWDGSVFRAVGQKYTVASAAPGGTWVKHPQPVGYGEDYKSIAFAGNGYVLNGTKYSTDGVVWSYSGSVIRNDVAWGGGLYVAAGNSGEILVSPDGVSWASIQTSSNETLISVEWTGSGFVAMTPTRRLLVSNDGYRWTCQGLFPNSLSYKDGCWDGSQYVVVGDKQAIYTTPDGRRWTTEKTPAHGILNAVCHGGGRLVAVGEDTSILHSTDGRNWQKVAIPGSWGLYDVHWTGGEFITVGLDGVMFTSANGVDWSMRSPGRIDSAVWDGSRFLAFSGRNILQSVNGNDWSPLSFVNWHVNSTVHDEKMRDMIWTGTAYVAVGEAGWILKSTDGVTWTKGVTTGSTYPVSDGLYGLAWSGSRFVMVGRHYFGYSDDGVNWTVTEQPDYFVFGDVAWNGSQFMAVWGGKVMSSSNGVAWSVLRSRSGDSLKSVAWSGSQWVVAGNNSTAAMVSTSPDGVAWTDLNGDAGATFLAVASSGGVHVAVDGAGKIKRFSGGVWTDELSGLAGSVVSLVVEPAGFRTFSSYGMTSLRSPVGSWAQGDVRVCSDLLRSVVSGGGKWVVGTQGWAGSQASILTSPDGRNWTKQTFNGYQGPFASAVWTGAEFHVVGGNSMYFSATGGNWQTQATTQWSANDARCITRFAGKSFIGGAGTTSTKILVWKPSGSDYVEACAGAGAVLSLVAGPSEMLAIGTNQTLVSQEGENWASLEAIPRLTGNLLDVVHTPLGFFAAGDGGNVWSSPDGGSWNVSHVSETLQLNALAWGNGKLVAAGAGVFHSSDGVQWSAGNIGTGSISLVDVTWGADRFVGVYNNGAAYSTDGAIWQRVAVPASLTSVVWTGTGFVAGTADGMIFRSTDGSSWSLQVLPGDLTSIASGNDVVIAGTSSGKGYRSTDLVNWTLSFDPAKNSVNASAVRISFVGGMYFCFHPSAAFRSNNGETWTRLQTNYRDIVWTGSQYVAVASSGITGRSTDGIAWTNTSSPGRSDVPAAALWNGTHVISVGSGGTAFSSPDGAAWTAMPSGTTRNLTDVAWVGTQAVALDSANTLVYFNSGPPLPVGVLAHDLFVSGGVLMAACNSGTIASLGESGWVTATGSDTHLNRLANHAGEILAVGNSGTLMSAAAPLPASPWTLLTRSAKTGSATVKLAAMIDGVMFSVGSDGKIANSVDGKVWSFLSAPTTRGINAVEQVDGDLLGFGDLGTITRTHPGGTVFAENSGVSAALRSVAKSSTRLVAVGDGGVVLLSGSGNDVPFGFDRWIAEQGASESQLVPDGDLDEDGLANIVEYLFGFSSSATHPLNDASRLPEIASTPGGQLLNFEIQAGYQDVEVRVLRTLDFTSWNEVACKIGAGSWSGSASVTEAPGGSGRTRVTVADLTLPETSRAFYRLRVKRR